MGMKDYVRACEIMSQHLEIQDFVGSRPETLVQKAEKVLGLHFPLTFRHFVLEYGAGSFGGFEVYGVINDQYYNSAIPNGVWATLDARAKWNLPMHYFHVANDGMGTDFCLDFNLSIGDESPVVIYEIGLQSTEQTIPKVADDFGIFFLSNVMQSLDFHLGQRTGGS